MKTLNEIAENYFHTLNPIAERISRDILAIKETYEDLWNTLSEKEKNQIINDAVVHPEALLKYAFDANSLNVNTDLPLHTKVTGSKYVVDESTGAVWRDEHSAPFSWKTPSQINLSLFATSSEDKDKLDGMLIFQNDTKVNLGALESSQTEKTFKLKFENTSSSKAPQEKKDLEKNSLSPESNVVLVGTCSKLSNFCSKLKILPSKSYSYEVQTVVTRPSCSSDHNLLNRLKSTAVLKFQNTLKLIGAKPSDKKASDVKEMDNLIQAKGLATIVKVTKASPAVSKPKSPPPPPPMFKNDLKKPTKDKSEACTSQGSNLIQVKTNDSKPEEDASSEKANLLKNHSLQSFTFDEIDSAQKGSGNVDDENKPLSGYQKIVIPKSGFDFLDDW